MEAIRLFLKADNPPGRIVYDPEQRWEDCRFDYDEVGGLSAQQVNLYLARLANLTS
jgi:hypothetical protein